MIKTSIGFKSFKITKKSIVIPTLKGLALFLSQKATKKF